MTHGVSGRNGGVGVGGNMLKQQEVEMRRG